LPVLYVAAPPKKEASGNGSVVALKINPDGSLTLLNRRSADGIATCHVGTDPAGGVVMAANYVSGSVVSFQTLEDGSLSELVSLNRHAGSGENSKRQEGPHAHSVFSNPSGTHAYVVDLGIDKIMIYRIDTTSGALTSSGFAEVPGGGMGPRHMKWAADGKYAYVLNELDLSLSVFKPAGESGALEWIATQSILPEGAEREKMSSAEIRMHPNGKFIYVSVRDLARKGRDAISVFRVNGSSYERIATTPAEVSFPRNFNLDPSGKWMLVGGQRSNNLAIFKVDPSSGLLEYSETITFKHGPICIEFAHD
jgi:6-phosphogluconolactonase